MRNIPATAGPAGDLGMVDRLVTHANLLTFYGPGPQDAPVHAYLREAYNSWRARPTPGRAACRNRSLVRGASISNAAVLLEQALKR